MESNINKSTIDGIFISKKIDVISIPASSEYN